MEISKIKLNQNNPQEFSDLSKLEKSVNEFPKMFKYRPIVLDNNNMVLGGNKRVICLRKLGFKEIPDEWIKYAEDLTKEEQKRFIIADNVGFGEWDWDVLENEWDENDLSDWGLNLPNYEEIDNGDDFELSKNPNDVYGGASLPFRLGDLLCYISDKQICEKISELTDKIISFDHDQKSLNEFGYKICDIILKYEDSILE